MSQQFKGVQTRQAPAPQHGLSQRLSNDSERAGSPVDEQIRVSYGTITEVNDSNNQVKVDVFDSKIRGGAYRLGSSEQKPGGIFIPILQPLHYIHLLYGSLRKGLHVRILWRGKTRPNREAIAEIISDADGAIFTSGDKQPESNELATMPYKIFSGGMIP